MYYRNTQEMLDEFDYLPEDKRKEIVITNTRKIADMCEKMESFPETGCILLKWRARRKK